MSQTKYVTPAGTIKFAHLSRPNKFGKYSLDLLVDKETAESFREIVKKLSETAKAEKLAKAKSGKEKAQINNADLFIPINPDIDEEGNETGEYRINLTNKAEGKGRDDKPFNVKIPVVDAKKKPIDASKVGRGSTVKAAFIPVPFFNVSAGVGASLRLSAVQVIDLVEYTGGVGGVDAFGEEEGFEDDDSLAPSEGSEENPASKNNASEDADGSNF